MTETMAKTHVLRDGGGVTVCGLRLEWHPHLLVDSGEPTCATCAGQNVRRPERVEEESEMTIPRYSREDMAEMVDELHTKGQVANEIGGRYLLSANTLLAAAAMLSEAANRAPTHAELVAMIEAEPRP